MASPTSFINQIRNEEKTSDEILQVYDQWAETYDEDTRNRRTEARENFILSLISRLLNDKKDVSILDCGAGSGHFGYLLSKEGYKIIDGVDGSSKMVEFATKRNLYRRVLCAFVGPNKLEFNADTYDLILCIGSLYENHIKDDCFPELLRITKPGGYLVFAVLQKVASQKFEKTMQKLHDEKTWIWHERNVFDKYIDMQRSDGTKYTDPGLVYVFQKPTST